MYDGPTYFAWFVLSLLCFIVVAGIVWLGSMPVKLARARNHPQADAINACSWWGLAFGGVGWVIAFVWALMKTSGSDSAGDIAVDSLSAENTDLRNKVASLEAELTKFSKPKKN